MTHRLGMQPAMGPLVWPGGLASEVAPAVAPKKKGASSQGRRTQTVKLSSSYTTWKKIPVLTLAK
jgi:hypothetical protein